MPIIPIHLLHVVNISSCSLPPFEYVPLFFCMCHFNLHHPRFIHPIFPPPLSSFSTSSFTDNEFIVFHFQLNISFTTCLMLFRLYGLLCIYAEQHIENIVDRESISRTILASKSENIGRGLCGRNVTNN